MFPNGMNSQTINQLINFLKGCARVFDNETPTDRRQSTLDCWVKRENKGESHKNVTPVNKDISSPSCSGRGSTVFNKNVVVENSKSQICFSPPSMNQWASNSANGTIYPSPEGKNPIHSVSVPLVKSAIATEQVINRSNIPLSAHTQQDVQLKLRSEIPRSISLDKNVFLSRNDNLENYGSLSNSSVNVKVNCEETQNKVDCEKDFGTCSQDQGSKSNDIMLEKNVSNETQFSLIQNEPYNNVDASMPTFGSATNEHSILNDDNELKTTTASTSNAFFRSNRKPVKLIRSKKNYGQTNFVHNLRSEVKQNASVPHVINITNSSEHQDMIGSPNKRIKVWHNVGNEEPPQQNEGQYLGLSTTSENKEIEKNIVKNKLQIIEKTSTKNNKNKKPIEDKMLTDNVSRIVSKAANIETGEVQISTDKTPKKKKNSISKVKSLPVDERHIAEEIISPQKNPETVRICKTKVTKEQLYCEKSDDSFSINENISAVETSKADKSEMSDIETNETVVTDQAEITTDQESSKTSCSEVGSAENFFSKKRKRVKNRRTKKCDQNNIKIAMDTELTSPAVNVANESTSDGELTDETPARSPEVSKNITTVKEHMTKKSKVSKNRDKTKKIESKVRINVESPTKSTSDCKSDTNSDELMESAQLISATDSQTDDDHMPILKSSEVHSDKKLKGRKGCKKKFYDELHTNVPAEAELNSAVSKKNKRNKKSIKRRRLTRKGNRNNTELAETSETVHIKSQNSTPESQTCSKSKFENKKKHISSHCNQLAIDTDVTSYVNKTSIVHTPKSDTEIAGAISENVHYRMFTRNAAKVAKEKASQESVQKVGHEAFINSIKSKLYNISKNAKVKEVLELAKASDSLFQWAIVPEHMSKEGEIVGPSVFLLKSKKSS